MKTLVELRACDGDSFVLKDEASAAVIEAADEMLLQRDRRGSSASSTSHTGSNRDRRASTASAATSDRAPSEISQEERLRRGSNRSASGSDSGASGACT